MKELSDVIGIELNFPNLFLERGHFQERDLILVDKVPLAFQILTDSGKSWYPTIRGVLAWNIEKSWAAVDHGAIPFLMNGADCMGAGIHLADPDIEPGDLMWIKDQQHGKPLAIGMALVSGNEMIKMTKGKAIKTIHWVGDELWELET
ncbi:MAG: RNA-binding protein [Euryarchaeota archaeon]|nr:RNA-binding protein [Euryarchaeota archaeon]|tara:strand:- start:11979 stop:12422 length:444 start_codon:yes stop_codon:yes gene_type:complete